MRHRLFYSVTRFVRGGVPAFAGMANLWMAATAQAAEVTVVPVSVASGHFAAEHCISEADPKVANECVCKADIVKAQVGGLPAAIATTINNQLSQLPEQLAMESCAGKSVAALEAAVSVSMASTKYELLYRSPTILSILVTYATGSVGAAHPIPGSEGYTFDLTNGKTMNALALLTPEQLAKANIFVRQELLKKYGDTMLDEARNHIGAYLTDAGCENCTLYYTKEGWNARFSVYSVAPYAVGEPTIVIPTTIIAEPETLIARKK